MNTQELFSALLIENELGLIENDKIVRLADRKISENENPPYWLIEFSVEGKSNEFLRLDSEEVIRSVLGVAYQHWMRKELTDLRFRNILKDLCGILNHQSYIYHILDWVEDDLGLIEDGTLKRENQIGGICQQLEKLIG